MSAPCAQSLAKLKRDVDGRGLPERAQYVWLLGCGANISDAQLDAFAKYGTGIGPDKVPPDPQCSPATVDLCVGKLTGWEFASSSLW